MSLIIGTTRGGAQWTPSFVTSLDHSHCLGCGRCYKVCPREVFELVDREELDLEDFDDDDDGFSDDTSMVMMLKDMMDCIGCEACSRVCPKGCLSHAPHPVAA